MTHPYGPPPPPIAPYGAVTYRKPRPSGWWWLVGAALVVAAVVMLVVLNVLAFSSVVRTIRDQTSVDADGRPHAVRIHAHRGYLWRSTGSQTPDCRIVDRTTGRALSLGRPNGDTSATVDDESYDAISGFDTGSGDLSVTCTSADPTDSVLVGAKPDVARPVVLLLVAWLVSPVVGLAGVVTLIVMLILWSTRPPRQPLGNTGGYPGGPGNLPPTTYVP